MWSTFIFSWMEKAKKIIIKLQTKQNRCRFIVCRLWENKNGECFGKFPFLWNSFALAMISKILNNQNWKMNAWGKLNEGFCVKPGATCFIFTITHEEPERFISCWVHYFERKTRAEHSIKMRRTGFENVTHYSAVTLRSRWSKKQNGGPLLVFKTRWVCMHEHKLVCGLTVW